MLIASYSMTSHFQAESESIISIASHSLAADSKRISAKPSLKAKQIQLFQALKCSVFQTPYQFGIIYELAERGLHPTGQVINKGTEEYWSQNCSTRDVTSNLLSAGLCNPDHNTLSLEVCIGALVKTLDSRSQ